MLVGVLGPLPALPVIARGSGLVGLAASNPEHHIPPSATSVDRQPGRHHPRHWVHQAVRAGRLV